MVEVHTRPSETHQQASSNSAAEVARENRQTEQDPQKRGPVMCPSSPEEGEKRHKAEPQQRRNEEPAHIDKQPNDGQEQQKAARTPEDESWSMKFYLYMA